ncbi:unknown [Roseburia sp. CAG:18]|nr:unknown [Roseburia sp. CAG:18]
MDKHEFEQFVTEHGKDILRFCRMNAESTERGHELYQDTMGAWKRTVSGHHGKVVGKAKKA